MDEFLCKCEMCDSVCSNAVSLKYFKFCLQVLKIYFALL